MKRRCVEELLLLLSEVSGRLGRLPVARRLVVLLGKLSAGEQVEFEGGGGRRVDYFGHVVRAGLLLLLLNHYFILI